MRNLMKFVFIELENIMIDAYFILKIFGISINSTMVNLKKKPSLKCIAN